MFKMKLESGFDPTVPCKNNHMGHAARRQIWKRKEKTMKQPTTVGAPLIFGNAQQTPKKAAKR